MESKAYRCYVPSKQKVVISRDVRFVNDAIATPPRRGEKDGNIMVTPPNDQVVEFKDEDQRNEPDLENESTELIEQENIEGDQLRRSRRANFGVPLKRYHDVRLVTNSKPSSYNAVTSKNAEKGTKAMEDEINSLKKNETWELVDLPEGKNIVGCKWVYKLKTDADGKLQKYKARLVAQGFSQKYGIDYDEVFAPVARQTTFRTLLAVAASRNMKVHHFDAKTAFLNGELEAT